MRVLATLLLSVMLITASVSANASYNPSDSRKPYIEEAISCGVVELEDLDNLQSEITRGDSCEIIVGVLKSQLPEVESKIKFDDTDNEAAEYLYSLGIINGKGDNKFHSNDILTREELAKIALNIYLKMHPDYENTDVNVNYYDSHRTSVWASEYVPKAMWIGVVQSIHKGEFGYFCADSKVTKEEVIETAFRLYNMRMTDGILAIPDEATALKLGKAFLEKYSGKQMEFTTDTRIYYLQARYSDEVSAWSISQSFKYKNPDWMWGGSGIKVPYVVLSEHTGGLVSIGIESDIEEE